MKTGLTIKEMAQELLRQSKAKQDYLVNTGSLSLSVTSDAPQLRVTENGLDKITPLDIRQTAHRQLGTYLGIPQKYYELMRTDAPELLAYNANYWFSQKNELRTLRTMDGCARAFLSNRYLHTSTVIAIHGVTPQQIRFETMNSHYCLLAPSSPVAANVPVTVAEQAA